jgi:N-acetylmuramoyl-L-alanine amidase
VKFDPRRLHQCFPINPFAAPALNTKMRLLIGCAVVIFLSQLQSRASEFLVFDTQGRKSLQKVVIGDATYLPIIDFLTILDLPYSESISAGYFQISVGKDQIKLSKDKSQVLINGNPVELNAPVIAAGNQWLAPSDFVERVLNRVLPEKIGIGSSGDRFAVKGTKLQRVTIKPVASEQGTRIAIQFSAPIQPEIRQEESKLVVSFGAAAIDPGREEHVYHDERVRSIRFEQTAARDQLVVELADKSLVPRVTHLASQNVYLVEVNRPGAEADSAGTPAVAPLGHDPRRWRHITIDAGHGGEDRGIVIKENIFEKDVALAIAKRVRWALQTRLGVEVVLSRSEDQLLSLEERVIVANRAQSNLFVSIHIGNSTRIQESLTYAYVAKLIDNQEPASPDAAVLSNLFVPWERVQFVSLSWSQRLAECLQTEMNRALNGGATSSINYRNAPLKLLSSLAMPAVLLEIGNARQSGFQQKANDAQFQNLVAATLVTAVEKFRLIHEKG